MVDEVFALSPISARAAQPNEADYEAIRDAFMETSRGRWFLGEYAKRNRNADTSMVLDAVARIEHALASQRQQQQEFDQADGNALPEALAAIRATVEDAALAATSAVDSMALEQNLAPVRKGIRIIKEISWRWREIGADSRICDLIDSQVISIEAACDQLAAADPKVALLAAFEIIRTRLKELDDGQAAASPTAAEVVAGADTVAPPAQEGTSAAAAEPVMPEARDERPSAQHAPVVPEPIAPARVEATVPEPAVTSSLVAAVAAIETIETPSAAVIVAAAMITSEATEAVVQPAASVAPTEIVAEPSIAEVLVEIEQQASANAEDAAAAEAQDEAILELVAAEMGAPDPVEDEEFARARTLGFDIEEPTSVDDDIVASFSEPPPSEPQLALTTTETTVAKTAAAEAASPTVAPAAPPMVTPVAEPVVAPPMAPAPVPSAPMPTPLPESIAAETLAAVAAAVAVQPPPAPPLAEAPPIRQDPAPATPASSTSAYAMPKPAYEPSLGSTLLSNGLLQRPQAPANDPLLPIRRMTQPEKIAFFS
ncbi:hypothetical protein HL667_32390 [Bradyrhizobium sp. 83012]|uniref:Uncharacterized protein n=1 Tax=Bradyrhizobium aeschynomenes TaxID=2734909 RepID=A0ABX2CNL5_9BRAD|nr:hypothetical protein [Bradyrhizobium aeschynomenes]NPU69728.1 hypothetical protein [Bradyrhizobium aeschynomenes]